MYAPPPPPPANTFVGKRVGELMACRSDKDRAELGKTWKANIEGKWAKHGYKDFPSFALHMVCAMNDNIGAGEEQWRNRTLHALGAQSYRGASNSRVSKLEGEMVMAKWGIHRRRFLARLFGG